MIRQILFITLSCKVLIWISTTHSIVKLSTIDINSRNYVVCCC